MRVLTRDAGEHGVDGAAHVTVNMRLSHQRAEERCELQGGEVYRQVAPPYGGPSREDKT